MGLMKCPDCGREISENAKQCPYCGSPFENENLMSCPSCGHSVSKKANACPNCGHPLHNKDNTIKISFPNVSLLNKGCFLLEPSGYVIAKCKQGETIEIKSEIDIDVLIKMNATFGTLKTRLSPGGFYQIKVSKMWGTMSIIESSYKI